MAADAAAKQWAEAIKLTYDQTKTGDLVTALKGKADYNKLKGTDIDAIVAWRKAEYDRTQEAVTTASKKKEVTDAWTAVEGKADQEKARHMTNIVYSVDDTCKTDGSDCKDGDKVYKDRTDNKALHSVLDGLISTYDGKVTPYISQYAV